MNLWTMVMSLTAMDIANASLLDEATAVAEAMVMAYANSNLKKKTFFVDKEVFPQTISVLQTCAKGFGIHWLSVTLSWRLLTIPCEPIFVGLPFNTPMSTAG